jgi:hypothetical protein
MASCDSTVLTGQEGLIQFKPLGSTNCVDDFCPFVGDRIYLPCSSDYDIGDCLIVDVDNIPTGEGQSTDGTAANVIQEGDKLWVVDTGKGIAGDEDACGNDMEGVPYIEVSATEGGSAINWDGSLAGEVVTEGAMRLGAYNVPAGTQGSGYNGNVQTPAGQPLEGVEIVNAGNPGRGAVANVTVGVGGTIAGFTITSGGERYEAGDVIGFELENGGGADASYTLTSADITVIRGDSDRGRYTFRLCEFQTVCGVRSFSIDLTRDELDVTTLPCSVSEACGKELASFRKTQAGFASATGELEVYFSCDQTSTANKLLTGSLQRTQGGATVRLYVCTKVDGTGNIIEDDSLFIEADVQLLGMSFSVNPDDPTTATINFGITEVRSAFGLQGT